MPLINCSECNKSISDQSDECVGCGAPSHVFLKPIKNPITEPVVDEFTPVVEINSDSDPIEEISDEEVEFDKKDPKYLAIKITNVVLFIILYLTESALSQEAGRHTVNPIPVFITYWISRWFVRYLFINRPNFRNSKFYYKIGITILTWGFVIILKTLIAVTFLNIAFPEKFFSGEKPFYVFPAGWSRRNLLDVLF